MSDGSRSDASAAPRGVTPALVVPHGFTARMFLRSTLLQELVARTGHVGIFAPPGSIERLRQELDDRHFFFYPLHDDERPVDVAASFLRLFFADWALTPTRQIREREEWARNPWRRLLWPAHQRIGRSAGLRQAWRRAENRLLPDPFHGPAFSMLRPDVVVTATIGVVPGDIRLIRRARAEGVPSTTFTQGWDNLTSKTIVGAYSDELIVWNERMLEEAVTLHGFPADRITVTGPPHFDPYFQRTGWVDRAAFLRSLGLDPARRVVVYATSPRRYFTDSLAIAELLVQANEAGRFGEDVQLVIRLHPQVVEGRDAEDLAGFERLRGRAYLDVPRGSTGLAADYTPDGIRHAGQLLDAADVTMNVASSITIDAAIFDTPVVNLRFDASGPKPYLRSVRRQYDSDHYRQVLRTGAVRLADSPEQLIDEVRRYLADPSHERTERARLIRELCYRPDGQAGARVAEAIVRIGARHRLAGEAGGPVRRAGRVSAGEAGR
ncbi:MAG: CDP-glycerol glycerophosphotransferase family protein [Chloroflexi bacterium]|nr:CDP-glycerol glycerophosphotransferase family protein [Chloroflexota bacterium]